MLYLERVRVKKRTETSGTKQTKCVAVLLKTLKKQAFSFRSALLTLLSFLSNSLCFRHPHSDTQGVAARRAPLVHYCSSVLG